MTSHPIYDASSAWMHLIRDIQAYGQVVSPRGMACRELLSHQSALEMSRCVVMIPDREVGYRFMAAEAAWILSGDNRVRSIEPYSKDIHKFSDDGITFFGAYGPRVIDQLHWVARSIVRDEHTRQAVLTIWRERPGDTRDVPCTVALQWVVRGGKLHCVATMRSSDAWLGWVYDVFNFSMISAYLSLYLREISGNVYRLGRLYLTAGSQHLYDKNRPAVDKILKSTDVWPVCPPVDVHRLQSHHHLVNVLWDHARTGGGGAPEFMERYCFD